MRTLLLTLGVCLIGGIAHADLEYQFNVLNASGAPLEVLLGAFLLVLVGVKAFLHGKSIPLWMRTSTFHFAAVAIVLGASLMADAAGCDPGS